MFFTMTRVGFEQEVSQVEAERRDVGTTVTMRVHHPFHFHFLYIDVAVVGEP